MTQANSAVAGGFFSGMAQFFATACIMVIGLGWTCGGFIGAVYWAMKSNLLQVVLSIFIPLWGALSVIFDLFR